MSDSPSPLASRLGTAFGLLAALLVVAGTLFGLSGYGLWDPWELAAADRARALIEGAESATDASTQLGTRLAALGFAAFGIRDWAGRLPIALLGLSLPMLAFGITARFTPRRTAFYAAIALVTTPFFVSHARLMLGATPAFVASALVFWGATSAVFPSREPSRSHPRAPYAWLALAALGYLLGACSSGVLLSVLPALGAVFVVLALLGRLRGDASASPAQRHARMVVISVTALTTVAVVYAVFKHEAAYSVWLGGAPHDGSVPTYERSVEQLFHSFAPWSALLPVALGAALRLDVGARADQPLRLLCVAWAALAYAAQSLFLSSYGSAVFPAPLALAMAVALWLGDREEERTTFWPEALLSLLLVGLVLRDFARYPGTPLAGLALGEVPLAEAFNPKAPWALGLITFGGALVVSSLAVPASARGMDLAAPYRGVRALCKRSVGHQVWLSLAGLTLLALLAFGVAALIPSVPLTSLARRIGRVVGVVPLALPIVIALCQVASGVGAKLAGFRHLPLLAAALGLFAYTSFGFLPAVSEQFSPRKLLEVYNRLAAANEVLVQYQIPSGAAHYYARGEVREVKTRNELVAHLTQSSARQWGAFPREHFSEIDQAFRRTSGRHLFVPADDHAQIVLVSTQPLQGEVDRNPLSRAVVRQVPQVQFPVNARFENKIELIGYNLELPGGTFVGPGQKFHVTWVFRALQGNLGTYKVFVHVDAASHRIPADHEPVDEKYPVRLWDEGDVILDRQEISVPATSRPGTYTFNIGFFRGDTRMKVTEGTQDGANRVRAGTLEVR